MEAFFENQGLMHIGLQILEYLDPKSLGNCRLVNWTWCELITEQRFWVIARLDLLKVKTEREGPTKIVQEKWKFWSKFVKNAKKEQSKDVLEKMALFLDHQMKIRNKNENRALIEAIYLDPWIGIEQLLTNGETKLAKLLTQWIKDEFKNKTQKYANGLSISCLLGLEELTKLFLMDPFMKDDINARTEELHPYIVIACQFYRKIQVSTKVKIVEALLQNHHDLNVNAVDFERKSALHWSAFCGDVETMTKLLARNDINVNAMDTFGCTPLHYALLYCKQKENVYKISSLLLSHPNIDVNATATISGITNTTPLHLAYCTRNFEVSEALLKVKGIDVNAVDGQGKIPRNYLRGSKRLASQKAKASIKLWTSTIKRRRI